jgi:hypothetical protein
MLARVTEPGSYHALQQRPRETNERSMANGPDLTEMASRVDSRESVLAFVHALIADREDEVAKERTHPTTNGSPGANGWENGSIEGFLDGAAAWADVRQENGQPLLPDQPGWRAFAMFLLAGKYYD